MIFVLVPLDCLATSLLYLPYAETTPRRDTESKGNGGLRQDFGRVLR
jgi:hypothetical protein